jgi:hypothetical protein
MKSTDEVIVELYGIPRQRAGRAQMVVPPGTLEEVLRAVVRACPGLADLLTLDGQIVPYYRVSLDGERFVGQLREPVAAGQRVLILSADAGG